MNSTASSSDTSKPISPQATSAKLSATPSTSVEAGSNNALIYTLLANCRAHDLDPEDYLVEVIKRLPPNATPEQAAALTPARIAAERRAKAAESAA